MDPIPATIPFHIARAYGLGNKPAMQIERKPIAPTSGTTRTLDRLVDGPFLAREQGPKPAAARLSAGTVPQPIRFDALDTFETSSPSSVAPARDSFDSFPMYRHPADKNAAATAINAGRLLDTNA